MFQRNISWVELLLKGGIVPEERFVHEIKRKNEILIFWVFNFFHSLSF